MDILLRSLAVFIHATISTLRQNRFSRMVGSSLTSLSYPKAAGHSKTPERLQYGSQYVIGQDDMYNINYSPELEGHFSLRVGNIFRKRFLCSFVLVRTSTNRIKCMWSPHSCISAKIQDGG